MIIHFQDTSHALKVAKSLKSSLKSRGHNYKLAQAQEIAAEMFGHSDFHSLQRTVGRDPASPWDEDVQPEEASRRKAQYIAALIRNGVPQSDAIHVVEDISPTSRRKPDDVDWLLSHSANFVGQLGHWLPHVAEFRRTKGYQRFQEVAFAHITKHSNWAENEAFAGYESGGAWIYDLLASFKSQRSHPLWVPAVIQFLATSLHPKGVGYMYHSQEFLESCEKAFKAADFEKVVTLLEREIDPEPYAFLMRQMIGRTIVSHYTLQFGRVLRPENNRGFSRSPETAGVSYESWISKNDGTTWDSLNEGDLGCFTICPSWEAPDEMFFKKAVVGDPDIMKLEKLVGRDVTSSLLEPAPVGPNSLRESVLVGEEQQDGSITAVGIYTVEHRTLVHARKHAMFVPVIISANEEAMIGAVGSICMGIAHIRHDWDTVFLPGPKVDFTVDIGEMPGTVRNFLCGSLAMAEDSWDIEDDNFKTTMSVFCQGKKLRHRQYG
ncbi:hypothetical protein HFO56_03035 [Rhizobium laguerreae]|uniref:hypothetical protein n=1 Tax=Rhizobium laguerreae TaxID=1076926 RepID=UPI001C929BC6|nr:hypothetical protein [Rhizobium laguerreae]MBY3151362.1 hypothetical protein [Rhizobium laguerreae]